MPDISVFDITTLSESASKVVLSSLGGFGTVLSGATYSGGSASGRTFIDKNNVLVAGTIHSFYVAGHSTTSNTDVKLKVFRQNGANLDYIGESDAHPIVSGVSLFSLATPLAVQAGDFIGVFLSAADTRIWAPNDASGAIRYITGDITANTAEASFTSASSQALGLQAFGLPAAYTIAIAQYDSPVVSESITFDFSFIAVSSPVAYQVFQRAAGVADITISGTYNGSPTTIEARWNGGAWTEIDGAPGGGTFSGTLSGQSQGQGTLEVRFSNLTDISKSVNYVGIGDVFVVAGQSNAEGRLTSSQTYSHGSLKAAKFMKTGVWAELTDPTDSDSSNGSVWPLIATYIMASQNVPVAFVTCADGSTELASGSFEWAPGGTSYNSLLSVVAASGVNGIAAFLWHQGENDAFNSVPGAVYKAALKAMLDGLQTALSTTAKLIAGQLFNSLGVPVTRAQLDAIRDGINDCWDEDADIVRGPVVSDIDISGGDSIHVKTTADAQVWAARWWHFIQLALYGGAEGAGPVIASAEKYNSTTVRVRFTVSNAPLVNHTDTTGWLIVDDTGTLGIVNCVAESAVGVYITVDRALDSNILVSFGSGADNAGGTLADSSTYGLPPESFFSVSAPNAADIELEPSIVDTVTLAEAQELLRYFTISAIDTTSVVENLSFYLGVDVSVSEITVIVENTSVNVLTVRSISVHSSAALTEYTGVFVSGYLINGIVQFYPQVMSLDFSPEAL